MEQEILREGDVHLVDLKKGYIVQPHEGLEGRTPSEACGIAIKGKNKWITLIQNASQVKQ